MAFPAPASGATITLRKSLNSESVRAALSQTWDWPDAEHVASHAQAAVAITDHDVAALERELRLFRVHLLAQAILATTKALALHWVPSQRLVDPESYRESLGHGGAPGDHAINVRMFKVPDGRPGETIMDTLGLAPFGLPDLQCHFTGLDPGELAPVLMGYAEYLFEKGDVLQDDDLVRGVQPEDEWTCQREQSLSLPARPVMDFRPDSYGVPH